MRSKRQENLSWSLSHVCNNICAIVYPVSWREGVVESVTPNVIHLDRKLLVGIGCGLDQGPSHTHRSTLPSSGWLLSHIPSMGIRIQYLFACWRGCETFWMRRRVWICVRVIFGRWRRWWHLNTVGHDKSFEVPIFQYAEQVMQSVLVVPWCVLLSWDLEILMRVPRSRTEEIISGFHVCDLFTQLWLLVYVR